MSLFTQKAPILISCQRYGQHALEKEFRSYGWVPHSVMDTGIRWEGNLEEAMELNLRLRTASSVLYQLAEMEAEHPDQVYEQILDFPWEEVLDPQAYFSVRSQVFHETVNNSLFVNQRVKDAIVDRFRRLGGQRPNSGPSREGAVIYLYWKGGRASLYIDSSGQSLARHGYRKLPGRAPMLEALAAATLLVSRWDGASPFINPMCGSGTLAIEAALISSKTAPGLFRDNYGFQHVRGYSDRKYQELKIRLEAEIVDRGKTLIFASDIEAMAVEQAKKNALAAGVLSMIDFQVNDFRDQYMPDYGSGVLFFNPEYGQRLGEVEALKTLYSEIGDFMKKRAKGYWGYVFTANLDLAKYIGLRPERRIPFFNAKLEARLLEYALYSGSREKRKETPPPGPGSPIALT